MDKRDEKVILVTRNKTPGKLASVLQLLVYCGFLYYITHPEESRDAWDRVVDLWNSRRAKSLAVRKTIDGIQSLPETDPPQHE